MKSSDAISVGAGTPNPAGVVNAPELRLRYQSSDENRPDQVVTYLLRGQLSIDEQTRIELRRLFSESDDQLIVREADVKLAGPIWFDIALWFADETGGAIVGAAVTEGIHRISNKMKQREDDPPALSAPPLPTSLSEVDFDEYIRNIAISSVIGAFDVTRDDLTVSSVGVQANEVEAVLTALVVDSDGASYAVEHSRSADREFTNVQIISA